MHLDYFALFDIFLNQTRVNYLQHYWAESKDKIQIRRIVVQNGMYIFVLIELTYIERAVAINKQTNHL